MSEALENILRDRFGVLEEDVAASRKQREEKGWTAAEFFVKKNLLTEVQVLEALGLLYDIPFMPELPLNTLDIDYTGIVPIQFLKKHLMVPVRNTDPGAFPGREPFGKNGEGAKSGPGAGTLIAINAPTCFQALDDLARILHLTDYDVVFATRAAIHSAINISYDLSRDSAEQLVQDMEDESSIIIGEAEGTADLLDDASDAPIIRLVNHIISQSVKARASDIHVEPYRDSFKVRYRVDGILYDLISPQKWIQPALISRIKVMAKLNIAEKRLPQDGRLNVKIGDQDIDVRVSTIPTAFGERVVLRLLSKSGSLLRLSDVGLEPDKLEVVQRLVKSPNGIILVTGPTGSGKTTTLYSVLSTINSPDINIITIEDPIEYQINGISQIQVNPKIDLTFARGLRSIVRQDPDVVLVGEIRDLETAEIAVQSALTGHLVFSTLHTNDSAGAIIRLVDLGVEPFLISSSVLAVVAQRLVRVLCGDCKQPFKPDDLALQGLGVVPDAMDGWTVYRSVGCEACIQTGFRGRIGIFEIMEMDSALKSLILQSYDSNRIKEEARHLGMETLRADGVRKIRSGMTTIEEVLRVTQK